ncbi:hypothetical protein HD806DRAFT_516128 [Xylariaceae sp. AK1471]|nr:hypothetical protein HD806DRAFT_516128 [Xylariaceae sp. AK1471]
MSKLIIALPLLMIALTCIAIYVQVTSSTLSLPISTGTTVLTILLPLFAAANIFFTPLLSRVVGSSSYQQLLLPVLHILQGGLAIIIATLSFQGLLPDQLLECGLHGNWQKLWQNHDGRGIERIQNAFDCCGFRSVRDMAWPPPLLHCQEIYDRHTSCAAPWQQYMQRTSGLEFMVAAVVGIIQLAHLLYLRQRGARGSSARNSRRLPQQVEAGESERLIEDGVEAYHDGDEEGDAVDPSASRSASGTAANGPPHRIQPSGLGHDEANQWRS